MRLICTLRPYLFRILCSFLFFALTGAYHGDRDGTKNLLKTTATSIYMIDVNNIRLPLNNYGVIADVYDGTGAGGYYDGTVFLFSAGFFLSGISNGTEWSNGVLSASRIQDYMEGPVGSQRDDPRNRIYVVTRQDNAFGESWQNWKDAVTIGADFHDGNGDGRYDPIDLNGDGKWTPDEDRPDLIGDITAWCVYNDGVSKVLRRFAQINPQGIEIHQSIFGFASQGTIGNMLFVRYRVVNRGTVADKIDSVYFSVASDPDLGDAVDDLVGCDTLLSAGYTYNNGPDGQYGVNCPAFLMDFFQGPVVYIPGETFTDDNGNGEFDPGETPLTEAYNVRGPVIGVDTIPGAKNLPLTSFLHYMSSHPTMGDPNTHVELRNYLKGGASRVGTPIDPCRWAFGNGSSNPTECSSWSSKFMYSGDCIAGTGWLNTFGLDQRMMLNTGPFTLKKDKPIDIVAAYVVGRSQVSSILSVNTAKEFDKVAQYIFDNNFPAPPEPPTLQVEVKTGNGFIDLTWPTAEQINFRAVDTVLDIDRRVQGYYVTAYRTNNKAVELSGITNVKRIADYEVKNIVQSVLQKRVNGAIETYFETPAEQFMLDSVIYGNPSEGRIRLRINEDVFTGVPLIKGKEYYFAVTTFTLNHRAIKNKLTNTYGPEGDYIDERSNAVDEFETNILQVVYDTDMFAPASDIGQSKRVAGSPNGGVKFLAVTNSELTGDTYSVTFKADTTTIPYSASYSLKNNRTGATLIADSKSYNFDSTNYAGKVTEGFIVKVKDVVPATATVEQQVYTPAANIWFADMNLTTASLGAVYAGKDIPGVSGSATLGARQSTIVKADRLRGIEVRFGQTGKAYRYMHAFVGAAPLTRNNSYKYAAGINAQDTSSTRGGQMGQFGIGYVDVPFQVWVKDSIYGEERQLAVGFVERSSTFAGTPGTPDGIWWPGKNVATSLEAIIVFDAPYDPNGGQLEYTGGVFGADSAWANPIRGFTFPAGATVTDEQKRIAASPLFNAMYVISLNAMDSTVTAPVDGILKIPVGVYPYTAADSYTFTTKAGNALTPDEQKTLFEKVNVYPNPLFAFNQATSYNQTLLADEPFVTFTNLPEVVTIKIYTVSGALVKTLTEQDKRDGTASPFLQWYLINESSRRVASGMYMAIVSAPGFGEKLLKLGIILPQKQLQRY